MLPPASPQFLLRTASLALLTIFGQEALAQEAPAGKQLQEMLVSGERGAPAATAAANVPAVVEGVGAQEFAEQINVVNTEDVVKYLPSTQIRKRYIGDRNSIISTRTSGPTNSVRSLVYADGVLLSNLLGNSYAYPPRWNMVSPEEIARVDVIYGPFAAELPGSSIGETVQITTRLPEKFEAHAKAQVFSENFSLYGTKENYQGSNANAVLGGREGDLAWVFSADHLDSHGHPMQFATAAKSTGVGRAVSGAIADTDPTGASRLIVGATSIDHTIQDNARLKLAYDFTPTLRASYALGYWQNQSDVSVQSYLRDSAGNDVTQGGKISFNGATYSLANNSFSPSLRREEHLMHALSLGSHSKGEWDWSAIASWYDITKDEQRTSLPDGSSFGGKTYLGQIAYRPNGDGWRTLDLKGIWRPAQTAHEVSLGYHFDQYQLDTKTYFIAGSSWQTGGVAPLASASTGTTQTQALYLQDAWRFRPDWKLTLGGRYEQWRAFDGSNAKIISGTLQAQQYDDRRENFFSPKVALAYDVSPQWVLRTSLGRAYRMPTVTELFQTSTQGGVSTLLNDPNLKPEKATTGEITAERDLGDGLLRLTLFQEYVDDALYSQSTLTTPVVTSIQNIDRIRTQGAEVALQKSDVGIRGLDFSGSVTYANSVVLQDAKHTTYVGNQTPGIPDWRATLVAVYRPSDRLSYTVAGRYSGSQHYSLDNNDSNTQTYGANSRFWIVDARVRYQVDKQLSAAVGVDNLNNYPSFAYHPMPQRTLHAELRYDY